LKATRYRKSGKYLRLENARLSADMSMSLIEGSKEALRVENLTLENAKLRRDN